MNGGRKCEAALRDGFERCRIGFKGKGTTNCVCTRRDELHGGGCAGAECDGAAAFGQGPGRDAGVRNGGAAIYGYAPVNIQSVQFGSGYADRNRLSAVIECREADLYLQDGIDGDCRTFGEGSAQRVGQGDGQCITAFVVECDTAAVNRQGSAGVFGIGLGCTAVLGNRPHGGEVIQIGTTDEYCGCFTDVPGLRQAQRDIRNGINCDFRAVREAPAEGVGHGDSQRIAAFIVECDTAAVSRQGSAGVIGVGPGCAAVLGDCPRDGHTVQIGSADGHYVGFTDVSGLRHGQLDLWNGINGNISGL
ncbi:hypothetical protein SDC9_138651 [bioreactor metagenome]|uniref:Uncharacterized protein n=1 Tax=bioreactor metagenome TaxID=1076179 RepID=A0A645DPW2_9ZZZZ